MQISERAKDLGVENAFLVTREVAELRQKGRTDIIDFLLGQPDFDTPKNIKKAAIKAIKDGKTGYTPSSGILELRKAGTLFFYWQRGLAFKPEDIVVANGAKPFIGFTVYAVTDNAQDEVIMPVPGYPIYYSQTIAQGAKPVLMPLRESDDFGKFVFDIDELKKKINKNTRLLILNFPQNPTGAMLTEEELREIAKVVVKYDNLWVLSDEVYSQMVHDSKFTSIAGFPGMRERTIIVDGVSKAFAMTGWRIGLAANKKLAPIFEKLVCNVTSCANHIAQYAAFEAIRGRQEESRKMMRTFAQRADLIYQLARDIPGFNCVKPQGAFYLWVNITKACELVGAKDSEEFRKTLLDEIDVAVLADKHFDPRPPSERQGEHIRFSYATSGNNIIEGFVRIKEFMGTF